CPADACGHVDDGCGSPIACTNPCTVTSVAPTLANTGDTVVLEGTFSKSGATTVDFPGAPGQPATVLGTNRATVPVPANATAGGLTVHTGQTAFGPFTFRRAAYPLTAPDFTFGDPDSDIYKPSVFLQLGRL